MDGFLSKAGGGVLCAIALIVVIIAYMFYPGGDPAEDSKAYAIQAVSAITNDWDLTELSRRASPDFREAANDPKLASAFDWFRTLGPLVRVDSCSGGYTEFALTSRNDQVLSEYRCAARYSNGRATITIKSVRSDGTWSIRFFGVNSPDLKQGASY